MSRNRFGVGASFYNTDGDGYEALESENFKEYYFTSEASERVIAVRTQIIHYFSLFNDFALFAGGGPFYSVGKRIQTYEYIHRKSNSESDIFRIYPSQVRLGLSIYF